MITIINSNTNPYYNLALEEYVFKQLEFDEPIFLLWQNEPSVIIGRNQNTYEEVNLRIIEKKKIPVVRRISGGGAVYHDLGNINFTFIEKRTKLTNFPYFLKPIIQYLKTLGLSVSQSNRNDLLIDNKKISGNAEFFYKGKILHHGTLLFDSDLSLVSNILHSNLKVESHSIKSNKSNVTNIKNHLKQEITINTFKDQLLFSILNEKDLDNRYTLTKNDIESIRQLMQEKYITWEWNYGQSPDFTIKKEGNKFVIKNGIIIECRLDNYQTLENELLNTPFSIGNIEEKVNRLDSINKESILKLLLD